ncbi:MAG: type II toxin-antitoxin system RelE/ParE family toxin [Candidatus Margulisbacteria bacterium]|nr:type II toxin-antitoxin system RelE/ParE family toxin [Candidatus Margulisiibacteriota bacterium]
MKYTIKIASKRIEKHLDSLPQKEYLRIRSKILSLSNNPRPQGVKKISDRVHRVRIGNYRVIYSIFEKEKTILIDKVARRDESTYK